MHLSKFPIGYSDKWTDVSHGGFNLGQGEEDPGQAVKGKGDVCTYVYMCPRMYYVFMHPHAIEQNFMLKAAK